MSKDFILQNVSLCRLQFEHYTCALKAQKYLIPEFENFVDTDIAVPVIYEIIATLHRLKTQWHQSSVNLGRASPFTAEPDQKISFHGSSLICKFFLNKSYLDIYYYNNHTLFIYLYFVSSQQDFRKNICNVLNGRSEKSIKKVFRKEERNDRRKEEIGE